MYWGIGCFRCAYELDRLPSFFYRFDGNYIRKCLQVNQYHFLRQGARYDNNSITFTKGDFDLSKIVCWIG